MDQSRHVPNKEGEMFPRRKSIFQKGRHAEWIKSTNERGVANRGRNKGENHGFRVRPSHHWMVVNIQASVNGSICQLLQM